MDAGNTLYEVCRIYSSAAKKNSPGNSNKHIANHLSVLKGLVNNGELDEKVQNVLARDGPVICEVKTPIGLTAMPKQISYKIADGLAP